MFEAPGAGGGFKHRSPQKNDKNVKNIVSGMFEAVASGAGGGFKHSSPPKNDKNVKNGAVSNYLRR